MQVLVLPGAAAGVHIALDALWMMLGCFLVFPHHLADTCHDTTTQLVVEALVLMEAVKPDGPAGLCFSSMAGIQVGMLFSLPCRSI